MVRKFLPRNSNFAIAHAAATPNSVLSNTAKNAVIKVRRIAASASLSVSAARYDCTPPARACANTVINGSSRKIARKTRVTPISSQRTSAGSLVAER